MLESITRKIHLNTATTDEGNSGLRRGPRPEAKTHGNGHLFRMHPQSMEPEAAGDSAGHRKAKSSAAQYGMVVKGHHPAAPRQQRQAVKCPNAYPPFPGCPFLLWILYLCSGLPFCAVPSLLKAGLAPNQISVINHLLYGVTIAGKGNCGRICYGSS